MKALCIRENGGVRAQIQSICPLLMPMPWGWGSRDPGSERLGLGGSSLGQAGSCPQLPWGLGPAPSRPGAQQSASVAVFGEVRGRHVLLALPAVPVLPAGPVPAHVRQVSEGPPGLGAADGEYCPSAVQW